MFGVVIIPASSTRLQIRHGRNAKESRDRNGHAETMLRFGIGQMFTTIRYTLYYV